MREQKFLRPGTVKKWAVVNFASRCDERKLNQFLKTFVEIYRKMGVEIDKMPAFCDFVGNEGALKEIFEREQNELDLIIGILPGKTPFYGEFNNILSTLITESNSIFSFEVFIQNSSQIICFQFSPYIIFNHPTSILILWKFIHLVVSIFRPNETSWGYKVWNSYAGCPAKKCSKCKTTDNRKPLSKNQWKNWRNQ